MRKVHGTRIFRVVVTLARQIDHDAVERENYRETSTKRKLDEHTIVPIFDVKRSAEIELTRASKATRAIFAVSPLLLCNDNRLYVISLVP